VSGVKISYPHIRRIPHNLLFSFATTIVSKYCVNKRLVLFFLEITSKPKQQVENAGSCSTASEPKLKRTLKY